MSDTLMRVEDTGEEYRVDRAKPSVPAGYRRTEVGVIPEDWDVQPLRQFCTFSNGVNADKRAYGTGIPFVNVLEAITYSHLRSRHIQGKVELPEHLIELFLVRRGDVVFNRTSEVPEEVGLAAMYCDADRVVFGGFVIRARLSGDVLNLNYAGYGLRAPAVRRQIVAKAQGAVRANVGQQSLGSVLVPLPGGTEQRAIAEALSDLDGLLEALDSLIAKKRAIKQTAMQQLLTGETRLPGFDDDWCEIVLGDLGHWRGGLTPSMSKADYWLNGDLPWLTSSDIRQGYIGSVSGKITQAALSKTTVPVMPAGSIIVVIRSGILRRFLPVAKIEQPKAINQDLRALAPGPDHDPEYLKQALIYAQDELLQKCMKAGTTVESIDSHWFKNFSLKLPRRPEQRKIAQLLADMDSEIAGLEKRRDKTQELKKGMMQQLMTGRTRLIKSDAPAAL